MMESINPYYCSGQQRDKRGSLFSQQVLWVGFVIRSASELGLKRFFLFVFLILIILHVLNLFCLLVLL